MKREIILIDEEKCTGCGLCIPGCPEGALQIIDGKARLISDLFCDGLGACIGYCPEDAITIEEREAEPYDERQVMENVIQQGANTIKAHLAHLKDHNEVEYYKEALAVLEEKNIQIDQDQEHHHAHGGGCPGSRSMSMNRPSAHDDTADAGKPQPSELTHWPIQMHLISPRASHFQGSDVLLAADCVAFSLGDFHKSHLKGKTLAIACPKLDEGKQIYVEKLRSLVDDARINTLTVMMMQVPCCSGLLQMAQMAVEQAERKIPIKAMIVGLEGDILREEWV